MPTGINTKFAAAAKRDGYWVCGAAKRDGYWVRDRPPSGMFTGFAAAAKRDGYWVCGAAKRANRVVSPQYSIFRTQRSAEQVTHKIGESVVAQRFAVELVAVGVDSKIKGVAVIGGDEMHSFQFVRAEELTEQATEDGAVNVDMQAAAVQVLCERRVAAIFEGFEVGFALDVFGEADVNADAFACAIQGEGEVQAEVARKQVAL